MQSKRKSAAAFIASVAIIAVGVAIVFPIATAGAAQAGVDLKTAGAFGVLAGSGITNTGPTTITGDIGSFPTLSETGLGTMTLHGADHGGDGVTQQAKKDLTAAYGMAAAATPPTSVATELGGPTLKPGVYKGDTLGITGTLTLDTGGDPNAVFIFQTPSTLITASNSAVLVLSGGLACDVFWQVGSSATLGTGSGLIGTVLASASITATTGATVQGRLLAQDGAVTLDRVSITNQGCAQSTTTTTSSPTTTAPGPTTTSPTTTAPALTTTVAPAGTTSVPGSSSLMLPSTTTTAPPSTPGSSTLVPGTTTTMVRGTPTTSPGTSTPALPFTGSKARLPIVAGTLLVALGIGLFGLSILHRPRPVR